MNRCTAGSQCFSVDERQYIALARVAAEAVVEVRRLATVGKGSSSRNYGEREGQYEGEAGREGDGDAQLFATWGCSGQRYRIPSTPS